MKFLKHSFTSIINKPFLTLIFIIQIIVSSNIIYSIINLNNQISNKVDTSIGIFKNKKVYFMQLAGDTGHKIFKGTLSHKSINEAYKMFKKGNFDHFFVYTNNEMIKDFPNSEQFIDNTYIDNVNGSKYISIKTFNIDESLYNSMKINLFSGNGFDKSSFNTICDPLPCIVGYNYSEIYGIGDMIQSFDTKTLKPRYFKVVGIMPKDSQILNAFSQDEKFINTNTYIIFPTINIDKFNELNLSYNKSFGMTEFYLFNNSYFIFNNSISDKEINNTLDSLNTYLEDIGIGKQRIRSIDELLNIDIHFLSSNKEKALKSGLLIVSFLALGLVTSSIYNINNSKKQYGIYLMSGGTLKHISLIIIFKNIIIFVLGFLISITYLRFIYSPRGGINLITLLQTFTILMVLCLSSIIIPSIKILRLNITDLLKEV